MTTVDPLTLQINQNYHLIRKIGSGSFGEIYLGVNRATGLQVAVKLEAQSSRHQQLEQEVEVYRRLQGSQGVPHMIWSGVERGYNVLVMELLGDSLEMLFRECGRKFSVKTVVMIADQTIARLDVFHRHGLLHRDVKPDNFAVGLGSKNGQILIFDYGLAKAYRTADDKLIPCREGKHLTGTARYASLNTHLGLEQSRRDDLESLGFMFIYFLKGLPWQSLQADTKQEKYEKILLAKLSTPTEELCKDLPEEFAIYLHYCRALKYEDKPDYSFLRQLFKDLVMRENLHYDLAFDWTLRPAELELSSDQAD
jgi:casein kinase 1 epsilon